MDGLKVMGVNNLAAASMSIEDQYADITEKFGLPQNPIRTLLSPKTRQESVINKAVDRLSRYTS